MQPELPLDILMQITMIDEPTYFSMISLPPFARTLTVETIDKFEARFGDKIERSIKLVGAVEFICGVPDINEKAVKDFISCDRFESHVTSHHKYIFFRFRYADGYASCAKII